MAPAWPATSSSPHCADLTVGHQSRASLCRSDVLVHPEEIGRIVRLLRGSEAGVVVAIRRSKPGVALIIHHEIRVRPAQIEGMHRLPVGLGPLRHVALLLR